MDMTFLPGYLAPVIVGICLCAGYVIKKWVAAPDHPYIPMVCAVLGVLMAIWIAGCITPEIMLGGMLSGLSATGLHQMFTQLNQKK